MLKLSLFYLNFPLLLFLNSYLQFQIGTTWNGIPIPEEDQIQITLRGIPGSRDMRVYFTAPFHNDVDPRCEPGPNSLDLLQCESKSSFDLLYTF